MDTELPEILPLIVSHDSAPTTSQEKVPFEHLLGKWKFDGNDPDVKIPEILSRKFSTMSFIKVDGNETAFVDYDTDDAPLSPLQIPSLRLDETSFTVTLWLWSTLERKAFVLFTDSVEARQLSIVAEREGISVQLKGASCGDIIKLTGSKINKEQWVHVAFVWNRESRTGELFYDGVSVATETSSQRDVDLCPTMLQSYQVLFFKELDDDMEKGFDVGTIGFRDLMVFDCALTSGQVVGVREFDDRFNEIAQFGSTIHHSLGVPMISLTVRGPQEINLPEKPNWDLEYDLELVTIRDFEECSKHFQYSGEAPVSIGLKSFTICFDYLRPKLWSIQAKQLHVYSESSSDHHYRLIVDAEGYMTALVHLPQENDFTVCYKSDRSLQSGMIEQVAFFWDLARKKGRILFQGEDVSSVATWPDVNLRDLAREKGPRILFEEEDFSSAPTRPDVNLRDFAREEGRCILFEDDVRSASTWADVNLRDRCLKRLQKQEQPGTVATIENYLQRHELSSDDTSVVDLCIFAGIADYCFLMDKSRRSTLQKALTSSISEMEEKISPKNLCAFPNPMVKAFEVQAKLRSLGRGSFSWTRKKCDELADAVEQFAVDFIDQIEDEKSLGMVDETIQAALLYEQKKFLGQSYINRLVTNQWEQYYGISTKKYLVSLLFYILFMVEILFFPVLFPFIFFCSRSYFTHFCAIPVVRFTRDIVSQSVFIGLHIALCLSNSTVSPSGLEYAIFVFFLGRILVEVQQYQRSRSKVYFRDMWNFLDIIIIIMYAVIFVVRIVTMAKAGSVRSNSLVAGVMYLYGVNTLLLILRISSFLELNKTAGPLQLALKCMLLDLWIVLVQFVVVIVAFTFALTKVYLAQRSHELGHPPSNKTYDGLLKTAQSLFWSLFGLTDLDGMRTSDGSASTLILYLYAIFLILSVIMLVNTLVALLNNTYAKISENSETEWKYTCALYTDQYNRCHPFPPPLNLITVPISWLFVKYATARKDKLTYLKRGFKTKQLNNIVQHIVAKANNKDKANGEEFLKFKEKRERIRWLYDKVQWERTKTRYLQELGDHFPRSGDDKLDTVQEHVVDARERLRRSIGVSLVGPSTSYAEMWRTNESMQVHNSILSRSPSNPVTSHRVGCPIYTQGTPDAWALAQYKTPLTKETPSFEVFILAAEDEDIDMSVGVVPSDYPLCENAGLIAGSVAFYSNEPGTVMCGKSYDEVSGDVQKTDGVQIKRDDIIRCTLDFSRQSEWGLPITFAVNGKRIWQGMVFHKHDQQMQLYPCIGIKDYGLSVIFKVPQSNSPANNYAPPLPTGSPSFPGATESSDQRLQTLEDTVRQLCTQQHELKQTIQANQDSIFEQLNRLLTSLRDAREPREPTLSDD